MSTFVQMFLIGSFLSGILADVDTSCDDPRCTQTKLIKANESQSITLLPCDYCKAKDCLGRQIIHQAWWSLNRSQIYRHQAYVTETSYSINLGAILVPQETIFTAYKYSCSESVRYHEMWDIKIIVIRISAPILSHQSSDTVSEGSPIVLRCSTNLPDSRMVKTVFHFGDHHGHCEADAYDGNSKWVMSRTKEKPYDCLLNVTSAQLSDSGTYTCGVDIPDEDEDPELKSKQLPIKVETSNQVGLILGTAVPGGILILAVIFILLSTLIWLVAQNRKQRRGLNDLRQRLDRLEARPQPDQLVVPRDNGDFAGSRDSVHTGIHPPRHAGFAPSDQLSLHPALQHSPVPSSQGSSSNHSLEAAEVGDGEKTHLVSPRPKRSMSGARREDEQPATYGATKVTN